MYLEGHLVAHFIATVPKQKEQEPGDFAEALEALEEFHDSLPRSVQLLSDQIAKITVFLNNQPIRQLSLSEAREIGNQFPDLCRVSEHGPAQLDREASNKFLLLLTSTHVASIN